MSKKQIKIGVNQGSGSRFLWNAWILTCSQDEATRFLSNAQYEHLAQQVQTLAEEISPSHSQTCRVDAIEDFFELRDWGGVLHPFNVRVFFGIDRNRTAIVVLGVLQKQNNGPTPVGDRLRMRRRWRKYNAGDYGYPDTPPSEKNT